MRCFSIIPNNEIHFNMSRSLLATLLLSIEKHCLFIQDRRYISYFFRNLHKTKFRDKSFYMIDKLKNRYNIYVNMGGLKKI